MKMAVVWNLNDKPWKDKDGRQHRYRVDLLVGNQVIASVHTDEFLPDSRDAEQVRILTRLREHGKVDLLLLEAPPE